ncbi:rhodanese-related sulfurtransferase [Anoxybacillus tepidamans]|uniref:Rhodanese-related sulfurtransferase n=1 Tax=Anoxybacteroides tepidamans TaxID=265948 RepID=A0A7W8MUW3_9BACL|nr:rhodanese-like domain-containing protein [Anoxybacillus tepidamans]MBB5324942.1 rhodanese-related sulfurtransferase [Anoxybacillus tepidamans]
MEFLFFLFIATLIYNLYVRYVPVCRIPTVSLQQLSIIKKENIAVVDLRDYNDMTTLPIETAISLPLSYLKRNYEQLPYKDVIVVTSDSITTNLGVRKLKRYGFRVKGVCCVEQQVQTKIKTA